MIRIRDFELEFSQGWFRPVLILEVDVGPRLVTLRVPMKLGSSLAENKARVKEIVHNFRQIEQGLIETLRSQFKGVDLDD